jgi:hypothetical protein
MAKVLCVLYPDPESGYPPKYAREDIHHPWRDMPYNAMTRHTSGTSLSAQARYAAGTREILEAYFAGRAIRDDYLIVLGASLPARAWFPTASPEQPAREAADRTLNLRTCTPGRDVPRESREKQ